MKREIDEIWTRVESELRVLKVNGQRLQLCTVRGKKRGREHGLVNMSGFQNNVRYTGQTDRASEFAVS